jgi:hypothetical protein
MRRQRISGGNGWVVSRLLRAAAAMVALSATFWLAAVAAAKDEPSALKSLGAALFGTSSKTVATQAALPGEAPPDATGATHEQTKIIRPTEGDSQWRLACFCLTRDGRIAAALSRPEQPAVAAAFGFAEEKPADKSADKADATPAVAGELRLLDADGKLLKKWTLDFEPQAISVAPDDTLCLAGDGVLVRFDLAGKQLARAESPQVVTARQDPEGLEARARATLEEQRNAYKQVVKSLEAQKESLKGKEDKDLTDFERLTKQNIDRQIEMYKQIDARQGGKEISDAQVKATAAMLAKQDRRVNAIAAGGKYVYTTTRANKGYGFRVWRSDLDLANSKQIVDGLSGCCGQMDVQCCGDDVVVAENSRKRVVRYDSNGKQLAAFGKASREDEGDSFGGCCNPMNTRAVGDKLYVSESNGVIKLFNKEGSYEGVVGVAKVQAGCKSSIVDVAPEGNRVYYIDVNNSAICVLERTAGVKTAAQ